MPELPEVETTLRALSPFLLGQPLREVEIRAPQLRQPTPPAESLQGRTVLAARRRAKYMLFEMDDGHTLLVHLGMSGRFSIFPSIETSRNSHDTGFSPTRLSQYQHPPLAKHDHAVLRTRLAELRYNDPRRFGLLLRIPNAALESHPLLVNLGPEPLDDHFDGAVLWQALRGRSTALKPTLMNPAVVVGVGNIYASESLFEAGLSPKLTAANVSRAQAERLAQAIKLVLNRALAQGGSTLRDYRQPTGEAGHFQDEFKVYGRAGQPCVVCSAPIEQAVMAQRSTFWCPRCQPLRRKKGGHA